MRKYEKLIFELSKPGRKAYMLPALDIEDKEIKDLIPGKFINEDELDLPSSVCNYRNTSSLRCLYAIIDCCYLRYTNTSYNSCCTN